MFLLNKQFTRSPIVQVLALGLLIAFSSPASAFADESSLTEERSNLFGNWDGRRDKLEDSGLSIESILTTDVLSTFVSEDSKDTDVLFNYDLTFTLDTNKAAMWENGKIFLYFLGNTGRSPHGVSNVLQTVDNIDADEDFKIFEAWYEHELFDSALSLLVGLYDFNSEFSALEYASSLVNSSFGIGVDIAQTGPSLFPEASLAGRIKYNPSSHTYIQTAVTDGVPGDHNHSHGTRIRLGNDDGLFYGLELGETSSSDESPSAYHKLGLGFWYHTAHYEDFAGETRDKNNGIYLVGESSIYREDDVEQGLGVFFQSGYASKNRNEVQWYLASGFQYVGLFDGRDEDTFALGINQARNGDAYLASSDGLATRSETILELTYVAQILPYLSLQPDLQWIVHPGTEKDKKDDLVGILRIQVAM